MEVDDITGIIIDSALQIHKELGPGLLESVYEVVLCKILINKGFVVETQKSVDFEFQGIQFREGFRCDMLINHCVVLELKSVEKIIPIHQKQLLTYLRLMNLKVGLLINFGAGTLKEGLNRIVNNYIPSATPRLRVNH